MTYRELIHLYKTGQLDEEQKIKVEKDIERQEAISEYLFEEEIPGFDDLEKEGGGEATPDDISDQLAQEEKEFSKVIKASIRKAFIKMGVTVSVVVILVVLFIIFALPKLVDCLYYNPIEVVGSENTDRLSLDMAVYSELFLPGRYADHIISDSRGYGVYDVVIYGYGKNVAGKIDKNKMILYDLSVFERPAVNAVLPQAAGVNYPFSWSGETEEYEHLSERLQDLEDDKLYGVYVTFSDVYSYSGLKQWYKENEIVFPQWCALCMKLDEQDVSAWDEEHDMQYQAGELMGFVNGTSCRLMYYDKKAYPNLTQYDLSLTTNEEKDWEIAEKDMTTHVISLFRYMQEQKTFNKMMGREDDFERRVYQDMIDNIETYGLNIYGFYGKATKEELLALSKLDEVAYIYTVPVED